MPVQVQVQARAQAQRPRGESCPLKCVEPRAAEEVLTVQGTLSMWPP
jgi:hypothetical protein